MFVEARTQNADGTFNNDWTTLPDAERAHEQRHGRELPVRLVGGAPQPPPPLHDVRPGRQRATGSCTPTGTTGTWNAASGNSGGWNEWKIDLSQYYGKKVEISIVYATDWGTLTVPGMLVDDTKVTVNGVTTHRDVLRDQAIRAAGRSRAPIRRARPRT